jgi:hypothetical protein
MFTSTLSHVEDEYRWVDARVADIEWHVLARAIMAVSFKQVLINDQVCIYTNDYFILYSLSLTSISIFDSAFFDR